MFSYELYSRRFPSVLIVEYLATRLVVDCFQQALSDHCKLLQLIFVFIRVGPKKLEKPCGIGWFYLTTVFSAWFSTKEKKTNKKHMVWKHWILPIDHFKTHLFFSIFGWGDPSQLGSWSEGCVKPLKLCREAIWQVSEDPYPTEFV